MREDGLGEVKVRKIIERREQKRREQGAERRDEGYLNAPRDLETSSL
jgi:hypothetical protein